MTENGEADLDEAEGDGARGESRADANESVEAICIEYEPKITLSKDEKNLVVRSLFLIFGLSLLRYYEYWRLNI